MMKLLSLLFAFCITVAAMAHDIEPGVYVATLVPMHEDYRCDQEALNAHCHDLLARGCTGITLFGTTGEGPSFSVRERLDCLHELLESGLCPRKIILANGSAGIFDTAKLASEACESGCAAMLIAPPCFFKNVSEEGVIAYYRAVIHEVDDPRLRIILYHIPKLTGVPITINIIRALREEFPQTVIGVKESEGKLEFSYEILETFGPEFMLFVGNESHIVETVPKGGSGAICGLPNIAPELICSLYTKSTNPQSLTDLRSAISLFPFIPAMKAVLGWEVVRPPLVVLSAAQKEELFERLGN